VVGNQEYVPVKKLMAHQVTQGLASPAGTGSLPYIGASFSVTLENTLLISVNEG
jgi:hypothetical protein